MSDLARSVITSACKYCIKSMAKNDNDNKKSTENVRNHTGSTCDDVAELTKSMARNFDERSIFLGAICIKLSDQITKQFGIKSSNTIDKTIGMGIGQTFADMAYWSLNKCFNMNSSNATVRSFFDASIKKMSDIFGIEGVKKIRENVEHPEILMSVFTIYATILNCAIQSCENKMGIKQGTGVMVRPESMLNKGVRISSRVFFDFAFDCATHYFKTGAFPNSDEMSNFAEKAIGMGIGREFGGYFKRNIEPFCPFLNYFDEYTKKQIIDKSSYFIGDVSGKLSARLLMNETKYIKNIANYDLLFGAGKQSAILGQDPNMPIRKVD